MNSILLDTNVLVYAIDSNSQFNIRSQAIFQKQDVELFTTSKNISEFLSVVTRGENSYFNIDDALNIVEDIASTMNIVFPNQYSFEIFQRLLKSYKPKGLKIHDIEIISIALAHNVNNIATFNVKDFSNINEISLVQV